RPYPTGGPGRVGGPAAAGSLLRSRHPAPKALRTTRSSMSTPSNPLPEELQPYASVMSGAEAKLDIYNRLLKERIVFLGTEVNDAKDIWLYINSPGGSVTAGMAIYDTMQFVNPDVATICMGLGASMGQFLLCAGAKGKRFALPHARILMHQPLGGVQGVASD